MSRDTPRHESQFSCEFRHGVSVAVHAPTRILQTYRITKQTSNEQQRLAERFAERKVTANVCNRPPRHHRLPTETTAATCVQMHCPRVVRSGRAGWAPPPEASLRMTQTKLPDAGGAMNQRIESESSALFRLVNQGVQNTGLDQARATEPETRRRGKLSPGTQGHSVGLHKVFLRSNPSSVAIFCVRITDIRVSACPQTQGLHGCGGALLFTMLLEEFLWGFLSGRQRLALCRSSKNAVQNSTYALFITHEKASELPRPSQTV